MNLLRKCIRELLTEANEYGWKYASRKTMKLDKDGMEQSDKDNQEKYLKSMSLMEIFNKREIKMKIARRHLRRIIKEVIEGPDGIWYDDHGRRLQQGDPHGQAEPYDQGYADRNGGATHPVTPEDLDYMSGWNDAESADWDEYPEQAQASREAAWEEENY